MFIALALLVIIVCMPESEEIIQQESTTQRAAAVPPEIVEIFPQQQLRLRNLEQEVAELRTRLQERPDTVLPTIHPQEVIQQIQLHQMKISGEAPFFLLVHENKIWQIGPDQTGKAYDDVAAVETPIGITCTPVPGKGKPLESELNIPNGRLPVFVLFPENAETFWRYRNGLKEKFIRHGLILKDGKEKSFTYAITRESVYEY